MNLYNTYWVWSTDFCTEQKIQVKMKKLIFILCLFVAFSMQSCVAYVHPIGDGDRHEHHDNGRHGGDDHHEHHD